MIFHVHTKRCGHTLGASDKEYIEKAISLNEDSIYFTDHAPFPGDYFKNRMRYEQLSEYVESLNALKREYAGIINVHIGLEIEFLPSYMTYYKQLKEYNGLEFLMMAQHFCEYETGSYSFSDRNERKKENYIALAQSTIDGINTGFFKYVAHPDRIFRYAGEWNPQMEELSKQIIRCAENEYIYLEQNESSKATQNYYREEFWSLVNDKSLIIKGLDAHSTEEIRKILLPNDVSLAKEREAKMIDFTNCLPDPRASYDGSEHKKGRIYNEKRYMLKLPDKISSNPKNSLQDSYSNSVYSEHVSCNIIKKCGYDAQNTLIGLYTLTDEEKNNAKTIEVVACENFTPDGYDFVQFKKMQANILDKKPGRIPKIGEIYQTLTGPKTFFSKEQGKEALNRYWDTFIFDAFLGNFDRHGNNWGYFVNQEDSHDIKLAPIYDCGSCLYPQIADESMSRILRNEKEILERIDVFPQAALELENGKKANYREYINSFANPDCTDALLRIYPKINMPEICKYIDSVDEISDIRKTFYKTMLTKRHELILTPAYEKIINQEKTSVTSRSFEENISRAYQRCNENKLLHTSKPIIKNDSIDK